MVFPLFQQEHEWTSKRFVAIDGKTKLVPLCWSAVYSKDNNKDKDTDVIIGFEVECKGKLLIGFSLENCCFVYEW